MGKTHQFTAYIGYIKNYMRNERDNARFLVSSDSAPGDFTSALNINGHIYVGDDRGFEFTQMVSAYTNGLHSDFTLEYSQYPSKNGVMLLGDVTIYYYGTSPVEINNSANLMILKDFENHKLTGTFQIISGNKPGLTIISGYDKNNHNNSVYYNITSEISTGGKNIITDINSFSLADEYNFEIIGDPLFNPLKLKIKKSTDDNFNNIELLLDRENNKKIGFLANNNIVIKQITMTNNH